MGGMTRGNQNPQACCVVSTICDYIWVYGWTPVGWSIFCFATLSISSGLFRAREICFQQLALWVRSHVGRLVWNSIVDCWKADDVRSVISLYTQRPPWSSEVGQCMVCCWSTRLSSPTVRVEYFVLFFRFVISSRVTIDVWDIPQSCHILHSVCTESLKWHPTT
jgi:hypothetical protein